MLLGKNIARETEIDDLRKLLLEKQQEIKQQQQEFEQKIQRQQQIMQQFSPASLIQKLGEAASVADNESEQTASTFLDSKYCKAQLYAFVYSEV